MNNLDFLNLNSVRNYPVKDGLSRVSLDSVFTIPNDLIVDLVVSAPGNDSLRLFISKFVNTTNSVYLEISTNSLDVVGSFYIPASGFVQNSDYRLTSSAAFPNSVGIITVGTLDSTTALPSGEFLFDINSTELLMRVYSPATTGVNYLTFRDDSGNRTTLTGSVVLHAESNLQFRGSGNTVIMDAGENLGLNKQCDSSSVPIKTINGIPPDNTGNFYLIPSDCAAIEPAEYGVVLQDTCGKPCLGCGELSTLTNRLISVESDLLTLRNYVNNLQGLITQLTTLINYQCSCE